MINLQTKIQYLKGVGPKMGAKLNKLGIETVEDLLMYFPRKYDDYTNISKIADISNVKTQMSNVKSLERNTMTIKARIVGIANKVTKRRGFTVTEAVVEDGTGSLKVVWFNQPYLVKMLKAGSEVILNGEVAYNFYSHDLVMESPNRANSPKIVPVYGETAGLSSYFIARQMSNVKCQMSNIKEFIPEIIIKKNNLLGIQQAIENIHEPKDSAMLMRAKERLAFDELFLISMRAQLSKVSNENKIAPKIQVEDKLLKEFTSKLPFKLTEDQKKAAWKIIQDIKGNVLPSVIARPEAVAISNDRLLRKARNDKTTRPMNRLLNGDVGSGKTVVAAFAAYVAIKAGYRVAMMAPTEILANQHYKTCSDILSKFDISVGLITSSQTQIANRKSQIANKSQSPEAKKLKSYKLQAISADLVIGTHALLQDKIELQNVGLVIVDEQHRFGVKQRQKLAQLPLGCHSRLDRESTNSLSVDPRFRGDDEGDGKNSQKMSPHFLSMTATPIPRTLYLALFADLDLSVIKTMPVGRKEIKTRVVPEENRDKAYDFIREQIKQGRQAFVVCPLIESQTSNLKSQNYNSKSKNFSESHPDPPVGGERSQSDSSVEDSFRMTKQELFDMDRKSVVAEFEKLDKEIFSDLKIGMLHGRMKSKEKEAVMGDFSAGKLNILVSTSVVEVGVDIPNATIMMIEDAERFGLAGLHQFRGRVGRASHQSYCFLFSNSKSPIAINRLRAMEVTNDGFKLAELDLKNRGAGDIFGVMQSGDINLKMASLSDRILIEKASGSAKEIIEEGISKYPMLVEKVKEFEASRHFE